MAVRRREISKRAHQIEDEPQFVIVMRFSDGYFKPQQSIKWHIKVALAVGHLTPWSKLKAGPSVKLVIIDRS